jgi:hypothetical protein
MITARYRFVDISGSKAETRVRLSRINEIAVLALADALRGCSNAFLYQVDILQRFVVRQRGDNPLPPLTQFSIPDVWGGIDVFHAWIPSNGVNDRDVADILSSQFATRLGDDLGEPTWEPYADLPVPLEPRYTAGTEIDNGWRLVLIRDQFWRELVADARRYNTQSLFVDGRWASCIRRDIYDLRRGMDVNEILQRLDTIIDLLQQGIRLDPYIVSEFNDVEELLANIIIALGAP